MPHALKLNRFFQWIILVSCDQWNYFLIEMNSNKMDKNDGYTDMTELNIRVSKKMQWPASATIYFSIVALTGFENITFHYYVWCLVPNEGYKDLFEGEKDRMLQPIGLRVLAISSIDPWN
jgi:hypothetical protein